MKSNYDEKTRIYYGAIAMNTLMPEALEDIIDDVIHGEGYDNDGYKIIDCMEVYILIIKSPYYTYAPECSPCVPNAGDLDSIKPGKQYKKKTYCMGLDFFDELEQPKYTIFRVDTNEKVN